MGTLTAAWGWPQWTLLICMLLVLLGNCISHGESRVYREGAHKGQPLRYNAFIAAFRFGLALFILSAGGFFG